MNYISAEQFLNQNEKVRKVLLNWWKPQLGDWATFKGIDFHYNSRFDKIEDYCFVESYNKDREDSQWDDDYGIRLYDIFNIGSDYSKYGHSFKSRFDVIPLFTETQLRKFIEEKTGKKLELLYNGEENGYDIYLSTGAEDFNNPNDWIPYLESTRISDILEAYWLISCKIAREL
jgi:hypothetical protein